MHEGPAQFENNESEKDKIQKEVIALAKELSESGESFSFSDVEWEAYQGMKAAEEEFLGYTTPIDQLIEKFRTEGMVVTLGKYPESGNVFIIPAGSSDIERDSIMPRQLRIDEEMDERVKRLITLSKEFKGKV